MGSMFKATSGDAWPGCKGTSKCGPCLSTWLVLRISPRGGVGNESQGGVFLKTLMGAWPETPCGRRVRRRLQRLGVRG